MGKAKSNPSTMTSSMVTDSQTFFIRSIRAAASNVPLSAPIEVPVMTSKWYPADKRA